MSGFIILFQPKGSPSNSQRQPARAQECHYRMQHRGGSVAKSPGTPGPKSPGTPGHRSGANLLQQQGLLIDTTSHRSKDAVWWLAVLVGVLGLGCLAVWFAMHHMVRKPFTSESTAIAVSKSCIPVPLHRLPLFARMSVRLVVLYTAQCGAPFLLSVSLYLVLRPVLLERCCISKEWFPHNYLSSVSCR